MENVSLTARLGGATPQAKAGQAVSGEATSSSQAAAPQKQNTPNALDNFVTSPKGVFDPESGLYLLQYRDQSTGQVTRQYPSEKVVDAYKKGQPSEAPSSQSGGTQAAVSDTGDTGTSEGTASPSSSTTSSVASTSLDV